MQGKSEIRHPKSEIAGDWSLDPLERAVLAVLQDHRGRAAAISARQLAAMAGIEGNCYRRASPRGVQTIVKRLREEHGAAICSAAGQPAGYYLAETAQELEACYREHRAKALSTLKAMAALKRIHLRELLGQLRMEAEEAT